MVTLIKKQRNYITTHKSIENITSASSYRGNNFFSQMLLCFIINFIYIKIPWETLTGEIKFADIDNYLSAVNLLLINDGISATDGLSLILAEPGWTLILFLINNYTENPLNGFLFISWISSTVFYFFMRKRAGVFLSLIILFNPLVIDLVLSQIRSAFALALLLLALSSQSKKLKFPLVFYACTVHSVSFILIGIYIYSVFVQHQMPSRSQISKGLMCLSAAIVLALLLSYGREVIFSALGDRRAEYEVDPGSVLFVSFWMFWAAMLTIVPRSLIGRPWNWVDGTVIITFALAFFMVVFSTNGVRFIALAMPFLTHGLSSMRPNPRLIGTVILVAYQAVQFAYWF